MSDEEVPYRPPMLPVGYVLGAAEYEGREYFEQKANKKESLIEVCILKDGQKVAWAFFGNMDVGGVATPSCFNVHVDEGHRRRKLCTSMFNFAEHVGDTKLVRSPVLFEDGAAFWNSYDPQ